MNRRRVANVLLVSCLVVPAGIAVILGAFRPAPVIDEAARARDGENERIQREAEDARRAERLRKAIQEADAKAKDKDKVSFQDFSWSKGGFDTVGLINFVIVNGGIAAVKDFRVSCRFFSNSKALLTSRDVIVYDFVPSKGRTRFREFNVGYVHSQATSADCSLESWSRY